MHRIIVLLGVLALCSALLVQPAFSQGTPPTGFVNKLGLEIDVRSGGRILEDDLSAGNVLLPDLAGAVSGGSTVPQIHLRGGNVQVNDPTLDFIQIFDGFRPFVRATQSEVSVAAFGRHIVNTFNDSAGIHVSPNPGGPGLIVDRVQLSTFSVSNDGGKTWKSGSMPPSVGAAETFGDPSIAVDRNGVFYFANLAADTVHGTIQVNKSTDGGNTWSPGVVVQEDDASDKEWIAVGPDPTSRKLSRDNVYVTWTSFQPAACELRFGRSTDGGVTWTSKTIFTPTSDPDPTHPQNCLTFTNPVVDKATGKLYIPFLHFSNADQDFIQMLISDDAGETFHFANFNVPGAPDSTLIPVTQPGELTACGGTNIRLTIHTAADAGPGRFGFPRYINASRMTLQPALAAFDGTLYLAWSNSTSLIFGDPAGNSNILFIRSTDGGNTWSAPIQVNPSVGDPHHVLPAIASDNFPYGVHVTYYTQHSNGTVDLDMANSLDGGLSFPTQRTLRVTSTSMNLPPTNIPLSGAPNFSATNYDRQIAVCYALGEYQSVTAANGTIYTGWGDTRNQITEPVNALDPISGQTHPQEDVFFQKVKAQ
jgi:BNR repeat protein